ncbi:COG4648 family protein [Inhella gelatinilytica]|uniref:DNA gyrase subunit B n=1 Tax=Inhella gelatinilytica TaxID=2795030 RepID=A0A931IU68_9BURK|nr:hypothetical protein [Inhella gelatinilytica]MBH9551606.1 hypothetical protein [Inhella gelatinilytica]
MAKVLGAALLAAYPLLVYWGLVQAQAEPREVALLLAALGVLRFALTRSRVALALAGGAMVLAAASVWFNEGLPLKLYPAVVNLGFLALFGFSLWQGPTVVERIARWREPHLDARGVAYTRRVTQVWCGFFVFNGGIALGTALWASDAVWAFYNGALAYVLMGALMGAEWCVRRRVRAAP